VGTLPAALTNLGYEITVPPPGRSALPSTGTYMLSGGSDGSPPSAAMTVVPVGAAVAAAMVISATTAGTQGNNIQVASKITAPNSDPTQTQFSVTVTETDTYPNLTPASIAAILGTANSSGTVTTSGSQPGLVTLLNTDTPASSLPDRLPPTNLAGTPAIL